MTTTTEANPQDFANYDLNQMPENGVFGLGGGVLLDMAQGFGYTGFGEQPTEEALRKFVGIAGKAKTLQDNVEAVQERLGSNEDATALAIGWIDRSGVMNQLDRSFVSPKPELSTPQHVDTAIITGGVARWMLRRADRLINHVAVPENNPKAANTVGRVVLAAGQRRMAPTEHKLIEDWAHPEEPTEYNFMRYEIVSKLQKAGMHADVIDVDGENGNQVMANTAWRSNIGIADTTLVVSNASAGIQNAGSLRRAARQYSPGFDVSGKRLFVVTDKFALAREGEPAATHQNPMTVLGQLARNALYLHLEQQPS